MKFDKFMDYCYKIMCIAVACVVAFGSVVSCFNKPVKARADAVDEIIQNFWNVYNQNLEVIVSAFQHDINSGNFDATNSIVKQRLKQIGLQLIFKSIDPRSGYLNPDWETDEPFTINYSGMSGFYYLDGVLHLCTLNTCSGNSGTLASSDAFNIMYNVDSEDIEDIVSITSNFPGQLTINHDSGVTINLTSNLFSSYNAYYSGSAYDGLYIVCDSRYIPSFSSSFPGSLSKRFIACGIGEEYTLPEDTVDPNKPWEYYNDTLLPYIKQTFPNYDIDYFVFPNGYTPPLQPDPTEPGTMPAGGISIGSNNNIDIDINVYYPTDESGQPVTDESGETVTETYYVTDTTPTDVVYQFTIPTLPNLDRFSETLPPMNLAQFESGINFIFSAADGIFTDTGFLPVIIVTLSLCALCYVIWKIGG